MATITVKKPKRTTVTYGSGGSSSSSSSGRVPANSYGNGDKYVGGNTIKKADGTTETIKGEYTSPSGKTTYTDDDGNITVTKSSNKSEVGKVYSNTGEDLGYAAGYSGKYGDDYYDMQVEALREAMGDNKAALRAAYNASQSELNNSIADAQRQAYVNQQRSLKNLPQTMAAAGYTGGVTETNAANISNEYQNALTDLEKTKAQELARLQADYANGVANVDTQYNVQIANALQQAKQMQLEQQRYSDDLALRQAAAALEQEKLNLARDELNAEIAKNQTKTATVAAPTSLTAANQQAMSAQSMAPLAAYYKQLGWNNDQIAYELNKYRVDPESAFYGYN